MTDLKQAAEKALAALERTQHATDEDRIEAANALRAALAAKVGSSSRRVSVDAGALEMVRNALKRDAEQGQVVRGEMLQALDESIAGLIAPAAKVESNQEPVAWMDEEGRFYRYNPNPTEKEYGLPLSRPVYLAATTTPAAKVGLGFVPRDWRYALRKLAFMARTSGGAAGQDSGLMAACAEAERLLALPYLPIDPAAPAAKVEPFLCGDCRHADSDGISLVKGCQLTCHYESINPHNPAHQPVAAAPAAPAAKVEPPQGKVVVTWSDDGSRILAVTRQDEDHRILSVIAEAPAAEAKLAQEKQA